MTMPPLQGLRVLDLARVLACPFSAMILAELGAEVIKVEQPGSGDESRSYEPVAEQNGQRDSAYFFACNRGKRSVTVNLRHKEGQALVRDLVRQCDAVVENFPTGTLKRYGLDWQSLRAINPRLVMLSCTGFGQTGPYAKRKGYDTVFQAMSGLLALTGERGGGPVKPGLPVADLTSGLWITIGLLAALRGRDATGQGAYIDFSMLDGQVALLTSAAARFFALNEVPPRLGTEHPGRVPTASFKCSDGRFLHITCSDQHWAPLCRVLGLDELGADPALQANAERVVQRERVMAGITAAMAKLTRAEAVALLDGADVPNGPVLTIDETFADPHVRARGCVGAFNHPLLGAFPALRLPYRFDGLADPEIQRPPLLGEDTEAVLRDLLHYTPARIATLRAEGAI